MSVKNDIYRLHRAYIDRARMNKRLKPIQEKIKALESSLLAELPEDTTIETHNMKIDWKVSERESVAYKAVVDAMKIRFEDDPDVLDYIERKIREHMTVKATGKAKAQA